MSQQKIPYFEFRDFPAGITQQVEQAVLHTIRGKSYILGDEVAAFESAFAAATGTAHTVGVGNGFDALVLALKAVGVGPGDEVIVPANTFIASANAVVQAGAIPVFAEPDRYTYNLTAEGAAAKISAKTKALLPVHLYGQTCDMETLLQLAQQAGLQVVEDAAQAHSARYKQQPAGSLGHATAFSFYPTKNLGALGDAGAVVTSDAEAAAFMRMYRNYGESSKYHNQIIGINSRLDTLQAAVLQVRLRHVEELNAERQRLAAVYLSELEGIGDIVLPVTAPGCGHVYHIFSIRTSRRDALQAWLQEQGIATAIHYPVPMHLQPAYRYMGYRAGAFPVAEELSATSLSLPLFPGMTQVEQERVIESVKEFF